LLGYYGETAGWCYDASCVLQKFLLSRGIQTKLIQGRVTLPVELDKNVRFHYWLEYQNRILDITGDQFNWAFKASGITIPAIAFGHYRVYPFYQKDDVANPPSVIFGAWADMFLRQVDTSVDIF
jgi:hypothetical protein